MRFLLIFAVAAIAAGALVPKLYSPQQRQPVAATANVAAVAPATQASGRSVTLERGSNGHFRAEARIDGRRIDMMVDTGASVIALRQRDAARLGIHPVPRDFNAPVSTANGVIKAARVELSRVEVGGVVVRDVAAMVLPDDALGENLLGMSFLAKLRWEQRNGRLILEQ